MIILTGGWVLCASCLLLLNANNVSNCSVRPWLFNLAFTMSFSPLLIKAWRVHVMFNVNPMSKNKLISNVLLMSYTFSLVFVDAIILAISIYTNKDGTKPITATKLTSNGAYGQITSCAYLEYSGFYIAEIVYKGLLIVLACYLSFKIRHISGTVAGSKSLLAIVYNVAFITGIILLINRSLSDVRSKVFIQVLGICFCVMLTTGLLVIPTFYQLLTKGDDNAADEVLDEIFNRKKSGASQKRDSAISMVVILTIKL